MGAAGPAREEISPRLTAGALKHLQPTTTSPALAAFAPEGLPSAKQGGMYWGKVSPSVNIKCCRFFLVAHTSVVVVELPQGLRTVGFAIQTYQ